MADDNNAGTEAAEGADDQKAHGGDAFVDAMTKKFDDMDAEAESEGEGDKSDKGGAGAKDKKGKGDSADEAEGEEAAAEDDADGSDEHTETDTPDDSSDGGESESAEDSGADDDAEHTEDDSDSADDAEAESDDDAGDKKEDDAEGDDDAEEEDASPETKATLAAAGADLKLEDVDPKYRPIVEKKLRSMDSAFTRIMQEHTEFRKEKVQLRAEAKFRKENPDAVVVELLRADPELLDRVNAKLEELADPTKAKAHDDDVKSKRTKATEKINEELNAIDKKIERGEAVAELAASEAQRLGLPWKYAERVVETEILRRINAGKEADISDEDVKKLVEAEAKEYRIHTRGKRRDESKDKIKSRTAAKKNSGSPVKKAPVGSATPRPGAPKKKEIDYNDEEQRLAALDSVAARVMPGRK